MQTRKPSGSGCARFSCGVLILATISSALAAGVRTVKIASIDGPYRIQCESGDTHVVAYVTNLTETADLTVGTNVYLAVKNAAIGHQIHFEGDTVHIVGWTPLPHQALSDLNWDAPSATKFVADGKLALGTLPAAIGNRSLVIAGGANVTLTADHDYPVVNEGGTVTFTDNNDWRKKVYMWADGSKSDSFKHLSGDLDYVYMWYDRRGNNVMPFLFRNRRYTSSSEWARGGLYGIMPYVEANALNERSVVRMSSGQRWMALVDTSNTVTNYPTACAVMVFGSHYIDGTYCGGGAAILGSPGARFGRGGNMSTWIGIQPGDYPITQYAYSGFYNGRAVADFSDLSDASLIDGWQILTVDTTLNGEKQPVQGIGLRQSAENSSPDRRGGQSYAEILLFSEMPTAVELKRIEKSLATKWGLSIAHTGSPATEQANVSGTGEFIFESGNVGGFAGAYRGTFSVKDPLTEAVSTVTVGNDGDLVKVTGYRYDEGLGKYVVDVEMADAWIPKGEYALLSGLPAGAEIVIGNLVNYRPDRNIAEFSVSNGVAVLKVEKIGLTITIR